jgi:hypothetical protein
VEGAARASPAALRAPPAFDPPGPPPLLTGVDLDAMTLSGAYETWGALHVIPAYGTRYCVLGQLYFRDHPLWGLLYSFGGLTIHTLYGCLLAAVLKALLAWL